MFTCWPSNPCSASGPLVEGAMLSCAQPADGAVAPKKIWKSLMKIVIVGAGYVGLSNAVLLTPI